MEDQEFTINDTDGWLSYAGKLLTNSAPVAIGLSCATTYLPRPGVELLVAEQGEEPLLDADPLFTNPPGISAISFADSSEESISPVSQHLRSMVLSLSMPESWRIEGVEPPSEDCKMYTIAVLSRLFDGYRIIPFKTSISKDGGIFAAYRNSESKNILRVEVDNELDAVAVVTDGSAILNSGLLEADDAERFIVDSFNRNLA